MTFKFHHVCIQTDCYEASLAFYRDVLGFEMVQETSNFHKRRYNTWLRGSDFWIELQTEKEGDVLTSSSTVAKGLVHFALFVEDIHAAYNEIVSKGYKHFKVKEGGHIYTVEEGMLFKIIAPEGTIIEVKGT